VARLRIRWSEHEARKPYARPFGVSFDDEAGAPLGGVALSGADLLYYRQFKAAVLALTGELFADSAVDSAADQQRAWLDTLAGLLPAAGAPRIRPASSFDGERGRIFSFMVALDGTDVASVEAATLMEYQEFQAALAHQAGVLFRTPEVEAVEEPAQRGLAWERELRDLVSRPDAAEAMAETWPWR
jgi:hypothetical protein